MAEARVPRLSLDEAKALAAEHGLPAQMAELSVFRVLLRNPGVAKGLVGLLTALLFRGSLDARLRELAIMRIGWVTRSEYEWTQHWRVSKQLGLADDVLLAVRDWRASRVLTDADRAVLAATDETLADGVISRASWAELEKHLSPEHRIELVAAIGNWRLFSSLLRSLEIPLEDGVAPWPPDGRRPA